MTQERRLRILLIDDDALVVRALGHLLGLDYEVTMATDPQSALSAAKTETFDAVLVDLHMPGMDGFEVREALLAIKPLLKVIIMTGGVSSSEWGRISGLAHIDKPFKLEELAALLAQEDEGTVG
jgi:CheY-like chemotaxis protein